FGDCLRGYAFDAVTYVLELVWPWLPVDKGEAEENRQSWNSILEKSWYGPNDLAKTRQEQPRHAEENHATTVYFKAITILQEQARAKIGKLNVFLLEGVIVRLGPTPFHALQLRQIINERRPYKLSGSQIHIFLHWIGQKEIPWMQEDVLPRQA